MKLPHSPISAAQSRAARALLGLSQSDLSDLARVARQTVVDFERGARKPYSSSMIAIRSALEAAGVAFIPENGGGAGVRLNKPTDPG